MSVMNLKLPQNSGPRRRRQRRECAPRDAASPPAPGQQQFRNALVLRLKLMALEALNRFVELHTPNSRILHALAVARFQAVDYPGSLAAAEQATALDKALTAAWHYQGLALERMGKTEAAQERFKEASAQDADNFPAHPGWDDLDWQGILDAALDRLPQSLHVPAML